MNSGKSPRPTISLEALLKTRTPPGASLDEEVRRLVDSYGWEAVSKSAKRLAKPNKRKQMQNDDYRILIPILRDEARRQLAGQAPSTRTKLVEMAASEIPAKQSESAVYRRLLRRLSVPGMDAYRAIIAMDVAELEFTCVELVKACREAEKIEEAAPFAAVFMKQINRALSYIWAVDEEVKPDVTFSEMMARGTKARELYIRNHPDEFLLETGAKEPDKS